MKIFLTGATGFVGSVLIPELVKIQNIRSIKVLKMVNEETPDYLIHPKIEVFISNVLDKNGLVRGVSGCTHLIHLAGLISYFKNDYEKLHAVNCIGVKNIVETCLINKIQRLIHISSVGAIGFKTGGELADENTEYNWPDYFHYMKTKKEGQDVVLDAIKNKNLSAVILNPASIMGPGDKNIQSPQNQMYDRLYNKKLVGAFTGGLAVVDVRDLVAVIIKSLNKKEFKWDKYLIIGDNCTYQDLIKLLSKKSKKKVYPFKIPAAVITLVGIVSEFFSGIFKTKALLTYSYGKISGMFGYYSNKRSIEEFSHKYYTLEKTIENGCKFFEKEFCQSK